LADTPVVLVNGARQTGKSTLVQSAELTGHGRQYLTFDDPGVLAAAKRDPNGFIAGLQAMANALGKRWNRITRLSGDSHDE
jgi:predicted AAA+ superfamily ATPase